MFSGYTWKQWNEYYDLMTEEGRWERSKGIAWYRIHHLIEQHVEEALNDSIEMKSKH